MKRFELMIVVLVMLVAGSVLAQVASTTDANLVGHWKFDEGAGAVVKDSTGNAQDGKIVTAKWGSDASGSFLEFDGKTSHVEIPLNKALSFSSSDYTLSLWAKVDGDAATSRAGAFLIDTKRGGTLRKGYTLLLKNNAVALLVGSDAKQQTAYSSTRINDGRWHLIVAMVDRAKGIIQLVVDGQVVANEALTVEGNLGSTYPFTIGTVQSATAAFFKGALDEVRVYNRLLTKEEIASLKR